MEAFTIRRDDTNALLKFNFELPISETALQIDCNFLEGTSKFSACLPRARGSGASFPSYRLLKGDGSELLSASQEVPKILASPSFRGAGAGAGEDRTRGEGAGGGLRSPRRWEGSKRWEWAEEGRRGGGACAGGGRGSSSIPASLEEPQLVTQKFLFRSSRYTPRLASCGQARGPESGRGDRRPGRSVRRPHPPQVPDPDPKQSPHSRSRIRYLPGAPGPSVTASPAGRALGGSRSPGRTKWSPPAG